MALATSDRIQMRRGTAVETLWGETPSLPAMTQFGITSANVNSGKTTVNSAEIRRDRMLPDIIQTGFEGSADFGFELKFLEYDWALESLFGSVFTGNTLVMGTQQSSYLLEQEFSDVTQFKYLTGVRCSQMTLNLTARQIINGTFNFLGKQMFAVLATRAGSSAAASTNSSMNASTNVASILEGGIAVSAPIRSITITINGNLRPLNQIGSLALAQIGDGTFNVSGRIEAYFQDSTIYDKVLSHATTSLAFRTIDDAGQGYDWLFPAIKLTGDPNAAGQNQDIVLPLDWAAKYDATTGTMARIEKVTY